MKSIKTFGLAAIMALALTAFLGASSASAALFHSELSKTTWKGSRVGSNHVLSLGETISCSNVSFSGNSEGAYTQELTVEPELKGCKWMIYTEAQWVMHGCKFRVHAGPSNTEQIVGWVDIVGCESAMTLSAAACELQIGNQNGIGTVEYKSSMLEGHEVITAIAKLSSITYTRNASGGCNNNKSGTFTDGEYTGEWTVKGFNEEGSAQTNVAAVPYHAETFFSEKSGSFSGQRGPGQLTGVFAIGGGGSVACKEHILSGSIGTSASSLSVAAVYHGCSFVGQTINDIEMGGCGYTIHASGTFDVAGSQCATAPIRMTLPGCVVTIGPQTGVAGLNYTMAGSKASRNLQIGGEALGLAMTEVGAGCPQPGSTSGGFKGKDLLTSANGIWAA